MLLLPPNDFYCHIKMVRLFVVTGFAVLCIAFTLSAVEFYYYSPVSDVVSCSMDFGEVFV